MQLEPEDEETPKKKGLSMGILGVLALIYIVSPIDFLPEAFLGLVGLVDDAAAAAVLLSVLAYYGIDLRKAVGLKPSPNKKEKRVKGKVVDEEV